MTKDLVLRGDTTIALRLTDAELDTLYRTVLDLDIFELPEPHPAAHPRLILPRTSTHVLVRSRGRTREFRWETGFEPTGASASQWQRLRELLKVTQRMVERHPAYMRLPAPEGGYM